MLADVCRGWLADADLPSVLQGWKRTDTSVDPCTFRGVDFEMQALRAEASEKGIATSSLRSEADFNAVMRYPELVIKGDWPALARETGVYTNEKHLRELVKRCLQKNLTDAALKERGLQQLLARLRSGEGGHAPRELLTLAGSPPETALGAAGLLPAAQGGDVEGERQVTVRHELPPAPTWAAAAEAAQAAADAEAAARARAATAAQAGAAAAAPAATAAAAGPKKRERTAEHKKKERDKKRQKSDAAGTARLSQRQD